MGDKPARTGDDIGTAGRADLEMRDELPDEGQVHRRDRDAVGRA